MATISRGLTVGATELLTNTKFHTLVDAATISAIISSDFQLTTTNPIHIGTSAPSDSNSKFWYDTTNNIFLVKDSGGTFQPVGSSGQSYTNKSGTSVVAGDVVILDTANATAVKTTTSPASTDAWGVVADSAADNAAVLVTTSGFVPTLNVTGATSIGDYLTTSTTVKKADPSSSISSGAFARALTSDSSSVAAVLFGFAAQSVPGADTFEFEAGTQASLSTTVGTPTTVTFGTAFKEPPIVIATVLSTTADRSAVILDVTNTGFTAFGGTNVVWKWFACTAGTFEVKTGVFIQAGTGQHNNIASASTNLYQTGKTPAVMVSAAQVDDASSSGTNRYYIAGRMFGHGDSNLNFAGRTSSCTLFADAGVGTSQSSFVLISQTSTVKTGDSATADGSQVTINSSLFECGTVLNTASATPTVTFATAFSSAPIVLITGETRSTGVGANFAQINAAPSTTAVTIRQSQVGGDAGYSWLAIEAGHGSVSTARRIA